MNRFGILTLGRRLVAWALVLIVTACAPASIRTDTNVTAENKGYLLLSLGPAKAQTYGLYYNVHLRELRTGALTSVVFVTDQGIFVAATKPDYTDAKGMGAVYLLELPTGDYEVAGYRVALTGQNATVTPVSGPRFSVRKGEISYLARFRIHVQWLYRALPLTERTVIAGPGPSTAEVDDAYDADVAMARAKFGSELKTNPTVYKQAAQAPAI